MLLFQDVDFKLLIRVHSSKLIDLHGCALEQKCVLEQKYIYTGLDITTSSLISIPIIPVIPPISK